MKSLLLKVKALELEIEKDKDMISLNQALLHYHIREPEFLKVASITSLISGLIYGRTLNKGIAPVKKHRLKAHIATAQQLYRKFQLIMPYLSLLKLSP